MDKEENRLITERKAKLEELRKKGNPFINNFKPCDYAIDIIKNYNSFSKEELQKQNKEVTIAGRMMLKRIMGKASFVQLQDSTSKIQLYVTRDSLEKERRRKRHMD